MRQISSNTTLITFISICILLITLPSIEQWLSLPIRNTYAWWIIYGLLLISFIRCDSFKYTDSKVLRWYLVWNIFSIIRGVFVAENYWEWKNLISTGMTLLLPLSINAFSNRNIVQNIIAMWLKYALPVFFLLAPFFSHGDAIGRYLVPVSFLLLFLPVLNLKSKIIVVFFCLIVVLGDLSARSNVIKFIVPLLLSAMYYFRIIIPTKILEYIRIGLISSPLILFFLGTTGIFNVFRIDEYIVGDFTVSALEDGKREEQDLTSDTRTFLYSEVLNSALKYDYVLLGRTPARGNESESFGWEGIELLKTGKMERFENEVSILNIFTWTGIIGVVLYLFVFYQASYLAIKNSNSFLMRIVGLYVAFRWSYAWIEDFNRFDLSNIFLWITIGMCFSKVFRCMNDTEITYWVRGIFSVKYRKMLLNQRIQSLNSSEQKPILTQLH